MNLGERHTNVHCSSLQLFSDFENLQNKKLNEMINKKMHSPKVYPTEIESTHLEQGLGACIFTNTLESSITRTYTDHILRTMF